MPLIIHGVTPLNEAAFARITRNAGYWSVTKVTGNGTRTVETERNQLGLFSEYVFTLENRGWTVEIIEPDGQTIFNLENEE